MLIGANHYNLSLGYAYAFNPSIARYGNKIAMAYRFHLNSPEESQIAIATIDPADLSPIRDTDTVLQLPVPAKDPRLFWFKNVLNVSYSHHNSIHVATLNQKLEVISDRQMPNDRECEKNWCFYEEQGKLYCIYEYAPFTVLEFDDNLNIKHRHVTEQRLKWDYGEIRGGTPPVSLNNGDFITYFHSSKFYPLPEIFENRIYHAGWLQFCGSTFKVKHYTRQPILSPKFDNFHDPKGWAIVFPAGAIRMNGNWLISYGLNDWGSNIMQVSEKEMATTEGKRVD